MSVPVRAHAQSLTMHYRKTHLNVPHGGNELECCCMYGNCYQLLIELTEWTKGICHVWSRGGHFSPSLPGGRYLKLGSKSDLRAEISGSIVRYDALAPRPDVLLLWYFVGACVATLEQKFFPHRGENIHLGSTKYNTPLMSFTGPSFFNKWIRISV